jgi:hypothetical protein
MSIERMRIQLHGSGSQLRFLQEDDRVLHLLRTLSGNFMISRRRDTAQGGYVDTLTVKLVDDNTTADFRKTDVVELVIGSNVVRYRIDSKSETPQDTALFAYCDVTMMRNEKTAVV